MLDALPTRDVVVSLYDFTGEAVRPWAEAGFHCFCYDIQHTEEGRVERVERGTITFLRADLHDAAVLRGIGLTHAGRAAFMFAFPVCTDLAVSGARHFAAKEAASPGFQTIAAGHAAACAGVGEHLGCPYMIENPRSRLATLWRRPDHRFDPCDFGGYLPADDAHPRWPDYIPPRDAYTKDTWLWTGGGFVMPVPVKVDPERLVYTRRDGSTFLGSRQFGKLGGKSAKTKNIRSATPRGFARAVFIANARVLEEAV